MDKKSVTGGNLRDCLFLWAIKEVRTENEIK